MAEEIPVIPFQEPTLINDIFYSNRRLFNIKNADNSISVGYVPSPSDINTINPDQIVNVTGVGNIAVLGSFGANSNAYTPGELSLEGDALINGNNRISNAIFSDPNYYSLITNSNPSTTSTSPAAGSDGFGDPSVARAAVSAPSNRTYGPTQTDGDVRYPLKISADQDYIKFKVVEIATKTLSSGNNGISGALTPNTYTPVPTNPGTVILGTQAPLSSQNGVGWGGEDLNALQLAGANISKDMATSGNVQREVEAAFESIGYQINAQATPIGDTLAALAVGLNPATVMSKTARQIINPNLELLFNKPQLRPFIFTFKMAAREKEEAVAIKKIIKFFKQNMVPRVNSSDQALFLKAPYVFTIQYMNGKAKKQHGSINLISSDDNKKACALVDCIVNYTPLGTYMTFDDIEAPMVAYELQLTFTELEPIYSKDYEEAPGKDHGIGY